MKCPVCKDKNLVITERKDIEIDYCPDCRGVWLDRGELDKIIEKSASSETAKFGIYESRDNHDRDRHLRKHKSFLSELFD